MKRILFSLILLTSIHQVCAMNSNIAAPDALESDDINSPLSPAEISIFEWFEQIAKKDSSYFKELPAEDQEVFSKRIKYQDEPEKIKRSRASTARCFLAQVEKNAQEKKCDEKTLTRVLVKMSKKLHTPKSDAAEKPTDLLSARTYVWSQLMTEEQRKAWNKEVFDANPQQVETVTHEWSKILAKVLSEIGLVENNETAIATKAEELFSEKWAFLQKFYSTPAAPAAD